jgi:RND family efflux transporter MFP subunit
MKKKVLFAATAVAAVAVGAVLLGESAPESRAQTAPAAPQVTVAAVLLRNVEDTGVYTGRLQAVDTIDVRPRVNGYIDAVTFKEGASVHKGDVLFRIDPRPYQAEVDRLSAQLTQARAEGSQALINAERGRRLLEQNAVAKEESERLDTVAASARASIAASQAALDAARLNLGFTEVRAPIDGKVSNQLVNAGNLVSSGDVLTRVVSVNPIYAYFDVDEQSYLKFDRALRQSGKAPMVAMALADEQNFPHPGKLDFVDNQLNQGSGTIRLRAVFANADGFYTPGLYARIRLRDGSAQSRALIDDAAIGTDLGNKFVYVVGADHKVSYRKVDTGPLYDGLRVITDGLKAGDQVVVNGLQRVQPGAQVQAVTVAMDANLSGADKAQLAASATPDGSVMTTASAKQR